MKKMLAVVAIVALLAIMAVPVDARGQGGRGGGGGGQGGGRGQGVRGGQGFQGGGGRHFQGQRFHHGHGHGHGHWGSTVVVGGWYGPYWGGYWDPYWYPGYYPYPYAASAYYPTSAAYEPMTEPLSYIEQPAAQNYWYYCEDARAYFPYVQQCPAGWLTVVPQAAPESRQ